MIAIQALTVVHPSKLPENPKTGEIIWEDSAEVSPELAAILNKMIRSDFRDRYQSVSEVLEALKPLIAALPIDLSANRVITERPPYSPPSLQDSPNTMPWPDSLASPDLDESTRPWPESSTPEDLDEATMPWPESSAPPDPQDSTKP
jgi:serine/threonine protein kinase